VSGFSRLQQKDIVVTEGERRSVGNLTIQVGSVSDQITVQADITPVQTQSAERSADLDKHEIEALLALGLNYVSLLRALPGVAGGHDPSGPGGNTSTFSTVNGTRGSCTIPGVNAADPSSQGQLYGAPATDSLAEMNVKTSNFQAEYGGSAGASDRVRNGRANPANAAFNGPVVFNGPVSQKPLTSNDVRDINCCPTESEISTCTSSLCLIFIALGRLGREDHI
jgi:hypothetical protein